MSNHNTGVKNLQLHSKSNELHAVFEYLQTRTATATMTATALGIYRPNLCRWKRCLQKAGLLAEVKKGPCVITKCRAAYLSTNPELLPNN